MTQDSHKTVCVYKYDCTLLQWLFVGKHRSHYKDITAVIFLPARTYSGEFKLVSLGLDRCLVEYDIGTSGNGILEITSIDRMDQTAMPLAAIVWRTPDWDPAVYRTNLPIILVANDEVIKFLSEYLGVFALYILVLYYFGNFFYTCVRLWLEESPIFNIPQYKYKIVNYATNVTLATVLGPRYDHPVSNMQLITRKDDKEKSDEYLLFSCKEVVGLQKMPLDGNPWKHVGLLAHPTKVPL